MRLLLAVFVLLCSTAATRGQADPSPEPRWPTAASSAQAGVNSVDSAGPSALSSSSAFAANPAPAIVVGFVGGFIRHDDAVHGGVQLAEHLRKAYPSGVYVNVFENHRGEKALAEIRRLLDTDHDGSLSAEEKSRARIVIYGHSWGGSETVNLARQLEREGIPVMLTIQVDSVRKPGEDDSVIPANVEQAVNFYQAGGLVHGRRAIRAADAAHTQIIGSFRYDYAQHPIACDGYPWLARLLERPHIEIECDPQVMARIESLIRSELPGPVGRSVAAAR
jgi:hypothetical protein